jgi:CheY-like chemotaxis protein
VDDSEINREVARRILADQGAEVALADDGSAALAWLEQHGDAVDLVLMDVQMPVMDGIEATRRLRALPRFAHLPIVALTAGAFQSHHDAARAAGMSHFITKPFDIPLTIALIRRLTGRPDAGDAPAAALSATASPP